MSAYKDAMSAAIVLKERLRERRGADARVRNLERQADLIWRELYDLENPNWPFSEQRKEAVP